ERQIFGFAFTEAPNWVNAIIGHETVLEVRRLNLADGRPFARVTVWVPQTLGERLSRAEVEASPFHELLDVDLGGATQTIGAGIVGGEDADLLEVPVGSPVLVCTRTTRDSSGSAVLVSEHVFPAHLTQFVVDLPSVGASMAPSGLRLVEGV
ncbi:MAG: GntR family transcriptional regulator, partial [Acidimicrobiales bacterium]